LDQGDAGGVACRNHRGYKIEREPLLGWYLSSTPRNILALTFTEKSRAEWLGLIDNDIPQYHRCGGNFDRLSVFITSNFTQLFMEGEEEQVAAKSVVSEVP
jgi:hypothetical protein